MSFSKPFVVLIYYEPMDDLLSAMLMDFRLLKRQQNITKTRLKYWGIRF